MKYCTGLYKYKGFSYSFSEIYQDWTAEPSFLMYGLNESYTNYSKIETFVNNQGREYIPNCKTIKELKKCIDDFIKIKGKEKILKDLEIFIKNEGEN